MTPVDDVKPLSVPASAKVLVPAATFRAVATNLTDPKTRARFMVIAALNRTAENCALHTYCTPEPKRRRR